MIEIIVTDEFKEWFLALEDPDADAVTKIVELLGSPSYGIQSGGKPCGRPIPSTRVGRR